MRVFVAGSTGVVGKNLVPLLLDSGHEVIALARTPQKGLEVEALGARSIVADALDKDALTAAIRKAEPEVIIHQLTALAGVANFKKLDEEFTLTNRLRTEATETMLTAGRLVRARRLIVQSFCGWPFAREGGPIKTEEDPLDPAPPASFRKTLAAIRYLDQTVGKATDLEVLALLYGFSADRRRASRWTGWLSSSSASAGFPSSVTALASGHSSTSGTLPGRRWRRSLAVRPGSTTSSMTSLLLAQPGCHCFRTSVAPSHRARCQSGSPSC